MSFETPSPPQLQQPQPRRPYQSIAPNPAGTTAAKRQRDEDDAAAYGDSRPPSGNKRRRTTSAAADTLSDDDRLLIQLRETEALPWKDIAARFSEGKDVVHTTARLQMKYKRLRQRFRVWEEQDVYALRVATEYYERCKWQIISAKVCPILCTPTMLSPKSFILTKLQMLEHGVSERWPSRHCEQKWRELSSMAAVVNSTTMSMPQYSSPLETPMAYVGMPFQ
jgi:hypothetical protein